MTEWPRTAEQIADEIRGTCEGLHNVLERHEMEGAENDQSFCDKLDSLVFECRECNWWCEISEMSDNPDHDWTCTDCNPDLERDNQ